jgi:hypothetical protein
MAGGEAMLAPAAMLETWTLTAAQVRDWAATAEAGAELTYAHERHLARRSDAAAAVRRLCEQGFATAYQRPIAHGISDYIVRRLRTGRAAIGRAPAAGKPRLDGDMARVLHVIRQCVRARMPCPANRALAKKAGVHNPSYVLQKLSERGVIESRVVNPATGARIVTIVATGEATASPFAPHAPHAQAGAAR